jgi:hypothetical protein
MFQIFLGSIIAGLHFLWQIPLILLAFIGFPKFIISDAQIIDIASKKIDKSDVFSSQQRLHQGSIKNDGLIFSWKLGIIAYLYEKTEGNRVVSEMALITTKKNFNQLIVNSNENDKQSSTENHKSKTITLLTAMDTSYNIRYHESQIIPPTDQKNPNQTRIINDIMNYYEKKNTCTVFISGPPGTGKSTIAYLLALKLNARLCINFDPTLAGFNLQALKNRVNPTKESPLIIAFDEIDEMINSVEKGIAPNEFIPIWVRNKKTCNDFFDASNYNINPYVIFILTSNLSKKQISKKFNPCYLREGRVNVYATLMKKEKFSE